MDHLRVLAAVKTASRKMGDIVPKRGQTRQEQIDSAVEAAEGTNRSRDSRAAQAAERAAAEAKEARRVKEKSGVGRDDSESNKTRLLKQMEERALAAKARGDSKKADEIRARMKQLEELT